MWLNKIAIHTLAPYVQIMFSKITPKLHSIPNNDLVEYEGLVFFQLSGEFKQGLEWLKAISKLFYADIKII
ncbi:hypothetical protein C5Z25_09335 [Lactobacillus sp. CBA3605]|nr:hypothetical protein C5Z25_09335 [Lactobacillus sp. CBA3605]